MLLNPLPRLFEVFRNVVLGQTLSTMPPAQDWIDQGALAAIGWTSVNIKMVRMAAAFTVCHGHGQIGGAASAI